jgi:putative methanogenesis marker protein 8
MSGRSSVERLLGEIREEMGKIPKDLHITRMLGALVAISDGRVIKVSEPCLKYCPLADKFYSFGEDLKAGVKRAFEYKISVFGYFTCGRELCKEDVAIPYGASEMMMYALRRGSIDAAVVVCDGAGTVVTSNPSLVQGIGARMNGVFYTSPIDEVMKRIKEVGGYVIFPETAKIDQIAGLRKAIELGYRNIAVTINGFAGEDLSEIRKLESESGALIYILVVCTTGVDRERADEIAEYADLAWSCGSLYMREIVGRRARIQVATKIPVFILTEKGAIFLSNYSSRDLRGLLKEGRKYLVSGLHVLMKNYVRIEMGNFYTYLGEVEELPIRVEDEPRPLI